MATTKTVEAKSATKNNITPQKRTHPWEHFKLLAVKN